MNIKDLPRIKLGEVKTPIEKLENLSKNYKNDIYIKRDDLLGIGLGGNKVRKLEYILGDALSKNADIVITSGGVQSNHVRLTIAAANKVGLKAIAVLVGSEPKRYTGNTLLDKVLGAEIHFADINNKEGLSTGELNRLLDEEGERLVQEIKSKYEALGKIVYVIPGGGKMPPGIAGYINATSEIYAQLQEMRLNADYIVTGVGTASTIASLIIGEKLYNTGIKPIGILVTNTLGSAKAYAERVKTEIDGYLKHFGWNLDITLDDIRLFDAYTGEGYGLPSDDGLEAIKTLARSEGLIVDHIYTGKAFAGLLDLSKKEYFGDKNVIFLHTGGSPALFDLDPDLL
ncbi:MAG: D-cysteine desulfhydrase family protein [Fusobacteriaceae bacterium]|jgi:D-cysteine desulfhydrase family pyridoxal phosphate-dependent enzyme|nr:D-cysteine desulfhydrase family protein [Fusobacteriaceae bacterium]MBP6466593.1 D-cysteine desulfhydrase family protein [Fusobacteriaceae bacterium]MBP9597175.1 D-cysteine desulfhydrase family protein [Fusobacteriaceae bacterium]MBU9917112.1 D-cysteine desulfhydrase family protein [Fusobacteriaceae bacterium]